MEENPFNSHEKEAETEDHDDSSINLRQLDISSEKEVETDYSGITLRLLDITDVDDFMVWKTDENVCKFTYSSPNDFASREVAIDYIVNYVIPHPWWRGICLNGRNIGKISITPCGGMDSFRAEVGYMLGSKYWGKGIMTRAVKIALSTVLIEWPHLLRLEATVDVDNPASQRVLEKVGFVREGVLRNYTMCKGKIMDLVMFSLIPSDRPLQHLLT